MPRLQPIVQRLDESIRETIPGPQYAIKWKKVYYGLPELGWVIEMVAHDVSVNVVFFGGAEFDPPPPLGTTNRSRYVKLMTPEETQTPMMRPWIDQRAHSRLAMSVGCRCATEHAFPRGENAGKDIGRLAGQ